MGHVTLCVLFLFVCVLPALSDKHSLYYIYTALSKPVSLPGIYDFTALGMLNDREIDYYNSKDQVKVPKQDWMKEKMQEDYWDKGTKSRKSKEQWFKVNVGILMERMDQNNSDLHVLQWRHGCEVDEGTSGVHFLKGIDEYSYDGKEFLSFDGSNSRWIAPVPAAELTKRKWDGVAILNQYTKGYLEKECVDWLTKFMDYGKESLKKHSPPVVYAFAKKSVSDSTKLTLTCMATGFYPKDVRMSVRKYRTSLPDNMLTSSGIRPNDDETYQLRKSLDILENEKADYDCYVTHSTLKEPVITKWDGKCNDCSKEKIESGIIGGVIGGVIVLILSVIVVILIVVIKRKKICGNKDSGADSEMESCEGPNNPTEIVNLMPDSSSDSGNKDSGADSEMESRKGPNNPTEIDNLMPDSSSDSGNKDSGADSGKGSCNGSNSSIENVNVMPHSSSDSGKNSSNSDVSSQDIDKIDERKPMQAP